MEKPPEMCDRLALIRMNHNFPDPECSVCFVLAALSAAEAKIGYLLATNIVPANGTGALVRRVEQ